MSYVQRAARPPAVRVCVQRPARAPAPEYAVCKMFQLARQAARGRRDADGRAGRGPASADADFDAFPFLHVRGI